MGWKIILFIVRKRSLHHFEHECFGFGNDNTSVITFIQHVEQCSYNLTTTISRFRPPTPLSKLLLNQPNVMRAG